MLALIFSFVISGFLITRIIHQRGCWRDLSLFSISMNDEPGGSCRLWLFVVLFSSMVALPIFCLPPFEFDEFGLSTVATLLFASNFHFKDAINYFSPAAEFHPLLHTWSLAVEEQFYLLFPLLMLAMARCILDALIGW